MKLLIILSVIASGYADKLDRTYLPPPNAQTAGGSPGALTAPGAQSGTFGQGLPSSSGSFSQSQPSGPKSGAVNFGQQGESNRPSFGPSGYGQVLSPSGSGAGNAGQDSFSASQGQKGFVSGLNGFGQNLADGIQSRPTFGSSGFGQQSNAFGSSGSGAQKNGFSFPKGANSQTFSPINGSPSSGYGSLQSGIAQSNGQQGSGLLNQGFGSGPTTYEATQPERPQAAADRNAEILRYVNENDGESYNYSYETSNGISAEEAGVATNGVSAQGGYAYTGDDGYKYSVTYTADENGYQPQGEHLPTPPPIPAEILKSIEENARAAAAGTQEGSYRPEEYETEGSPQQYNAGASSYNQPQSQSQVYPQGQSQGYPQGQRNNMIQDGSIFAKQGNSGQGAPSLFGQVQPNTGFNPGLIASNGPLGQSTKQSGQNLGGNGQTFGRGQTTGYQYNQPQNSFSLSNAAQVSAGGQGINAQKPTAYSRDSVQNFGLNNQGASTPLSGQGLGAINIAQGAQDITKTGLLSTGTFKPSETKYQTSGTNTPLSQLGSSRPSASSGALEPTRPTQSFGQGKPSSGSNQQSFATNQPSFGASQPSKQLFGSSNSAQGYQYGLNANQPGFGNEIRQGARPSFNQGSQQLGNIPSNFNLGSGQGPAGRPQYQQNGNKPSLETKNTSPGSQSTPYAQFGPNAAGSSLGSQNGPIRPAGRPQYQQNGNQPSFGGNVSSQGSQLTPSSQYGPLSGPRESQQNQKPSFASAPNQGTRGSEFGGPRQKPSFSPQEGYKY